MRRTGQHLVVVHKLRDEAQGRCLPDALRHRVQAVAACGATHPGPQLSVEAAGDPQPDESRCTSASVAGQRVGNALRDAESHRNFHVVLADQEPWTEPAEVINIALHVRMCTLGIRPLRQ